MKFKTILELGGKSATGFSVPEEIVRSLGSSKRPAVNVTVNGYRYRSTIAPLGGRYMVPVSAVVREGAGIAAGDELDVELELDTAPREVAVPPDFADALAGDEAARAGFERLSFSNKQRYVLSIEGAKSAETRERRIARTIDELRKIPR